MRRRTIRRLVATALLLLRLVLPDFMAMPTAHAAAHSETMMTMMMAGGHCADHDGPSAADPTDSSKNSKRHGPLNDGTCCKAWKCPCLHAPALMNGLQIPSVTIVSYANVPVVLIARASGQEPVTLRPPI